MGRRLVIIVLAVLVVMASSGMTYHDHPVPASTTPAPTTPPPAPGERTGAAQAEGPRPYDPFTFLTREQCIRLRQANATNVHPYGGTLYNHFQWCAWKKLRVQVLDVKTLLPLASIDFRLTMLSMASESSRTVSTTFFVDRIKNPFEASPETTHLTIQAKCRVACTVAPSPAVRTLAAMALTPTEILMQSPESPTATNPNAVERGGLIFELVGHFDNRPGVSSATLFEQDVRCDSTNLIRGDFRTPACMFPRVRGTFYLNANDQSVDESARHIREAQSSPQAQPPIPPGGQSKVIPTLLERHWDPVLNRQQRATSVASCLQAYGPNPGGVDCDEFPFASTRQGSLAPPLPNYNYSVRYIYYKDNQRVGCWLNHWFVKDRILETDTFAVSIYDGPAVPEVEEPPCVE